MTFDDPILLFSFIIYFEVMSFMISINYNKIESSPFESLMSLSPPIRRLSSASSGGSNKREEDLINAYEAEEERIINVLSRKLEKVRPPCHSFRGALFYPSDATTILSFRKRRLSSRTH